MTIIKRVKAPSPKFFKVLRNIGLVLAAVGGTLLAAPIALPVVVTAVGGYLAVAGGVLTAVSQLTTAEEETAKPQEPSGDKAGPRSLDPSTPRKTRGRLNTGKARADKDSSQPDVPQNDNW